MTKIKFKGTAISKQKTPAVSSVKNPKGSNSTRPAHQAPRTKNK